ncbi:MULTISPECIES: FtsW/RodA/SpoVE family cell cycle protein [unclassified Butyrivibrio]|uniref:FtsW/RodA/SpoVE family cell cycle protein n=1 Tax=unclassified Butyrivibrio TaxID=2639466 RepID=UPI0003B5D2EE|nr:MULTISPECIES: putative peptidoglycan glycosyltransferase FtsW [unclassified Butyrivibrio]MDC7294269.1 putative lipid II flippase FtsW [Butyrivibrio sp. DSM 10294]
MERFKTLRKEKAESYIDYSMIFIILFLLAFGLVMLYSTSSYEANLDFGDSAYYFRHQLIPTLIGLGGMVLLSYFPYRFFKNLALVIYVGALAFLFALIPFGKVINGAKRWLNIAGFSVQPAEICKIAAIIFSATIIAKLQKNLMTAKGLAVTLVPTFFMAILVYKITDNLSSGVIILGIVGLMLFISTPNYKPYIIIAVSGLGACAAIVWFISSSAGNPEMGFRSERILAWLDPNAHASGKGFQTLQALYAIGSGGIFGKGLGESMQKMGFIPEAQNDMIFSIICEELGLFGAIAVMLMFLILIWRLMIIANNAPDMFGALLVIGVMAHISIQVILNIAVVTNTLPNTGITLPFISYGGSAVIMQLAEIGIALNVARNIGRAD